MNRTCTDTGIIFYCCIFVTIMGVLGRPISIEFLRESLSNKPVAPSLLYYGDSGNSLSSESRRSLADVSSDVFPLLHTRSEEGVTWSRHLLSSGNGPRSTNRSLTNTPEYMLELYNRLSKNTPFLHNSNIIRSFVDLSHREARTNNQNTGNTRVHSLTFNISTLDHKESINLAELRLYTLIKRDQNSFMGVRRFVSVFEVLNITYDHHKTREKRNYITSKYINSVKNTWESFDVTAVVKRSVKHKSKLERLEVRISSLFFSKSSDNLDINCDPNDSKQPILVVYSNDNSIKHEHEVDRHELVMHGISSVPDVSFKYSTPLKGSSDNNIYTGSHGPHDRVKRSRLRNSICRRRPMYVNFEEIGFDWIIQPKGYQAYQCAGRCYFPLSDQVNPTKHAILQLILHELSPRRVTRVCCVPTQLEPISLLYLDEYGVPTYKYHYDGMVVSRCGCR